MKYRLIFALAFIASLSCLAANKLPFDSAVRRGTLDNGLTYYIRHNATPENRADFFIAQRVGSINEEENQRGLAHFLEHMCFNGTAHFPGNSLITYLESIGVKFGKHLNAYTSTDETVYNICQVPTDHAAAIDSCLLILRDWSGNLLLRDEDIDAERGVIVGEWRQRNGAANNRLLQKAAPVIYSGSIYGQRMPIGLMSVVENFKPSTLRKFYKKWYTPVNQCVIVVGDVDVDRVEAQIKALWADAPSKGKATQTVAVADNKKPIVTVQTDPELAQPSVMLYAKHGDISADEVNTIAQLRREAVSNIVLNMLVDRFDEAEQDSLAAFSNTGIGDQKFLMSNSCKALSLRSQAKESRVAETVAAYAKQLKRAAAQGFLDSELKRAKITARQRLDADFTASAKTSNTDYARRYVRHYLDGGALPSAEQRYKMMKGVIDHISLSDVNSYIASVIAADGSNIVIAAYLPEKMAGTVSETDLLSAYQSVDGATVEPYVDSAVNGSLLAVEPTAGSIVAETVNPLFGSTEWTLSNGIHVVVKPTDFAPDRVVIQGYGPGGFSQGYDPALAPEYHLANDILAAGAFGNYKASELRRLMAGKSVKSALSIENMEEQVGASSSIADMTDAFRMIYLKSTSAGRDNAAFDALIANKRLKLNADNPGATVVMGDSIHSNVYSHHPFGKKLCAADLDAVSYDRVLQLYNDRFGDMTDFTFYIVGDVNIDSLRAPVSKYLASLPANGRVETPANVGYRYTSGRIAKRFTCPMETPQSICYTFYNAPCDYNLRNVICASIVGDIVKSRLMADLREARGWTYGIKSHGGISAGMNGDDPASLLMPIYIRVSAENAQATFDIVANTVDSLAARDAISTEELARVTSQMTAAYQDYLTDNTYWLTVLRMYDKFGQDMTSGYVDIVNSITPNDISDFVARYLLNANRIQLEMAPAE